ncbi:MAG: sugar phosphate isomerase/epimerase [Planctomycetes bacterium]|nr:sugar phosphate isomerase/epimerase [Planctomycetota bacterium]
MNTLSMNTVSADLEQAASFCRAENIGLEITDFAFPKNLDHELGRSVERHAAVVQGVSPVGSHGPFLDLIVTSMDPDIVEVCRRRHQAALEASHHAGARYYIAHANYSPLIRNPSYRKNFAQRSADFWRCFADWAGAKNMTICLENMWEPSPEVHEDILAKAGHDFLKASFDNGHALIYSELPAAKWIERLGKNLFHCHLHDNMGLQDDHKPVGEGKEDWPSLISALKKWSPDAILVAESDHVEPNKKSLAKLRSLLSETHS